MLLNDVLAVCVAGAVVVVIATILGAVELRHRGRRPHDNDPRTAAVSMIHSSKFSTKNSRRPELFTSLDVAGAQCDSRSALLESKAMP